MSDLSDSQVSVVFDTSSTNTLSARLKVLEDTYSDVRPLSRAIAKVMRGAFVQNIEQGGRPAPFAPLAQSTLKRKRLLGQLKTLVASGLLLGSLASESAKDNVTRITDDGEIVVGTDVSYAAAVASGRKGRSSGRGRGMAALMNSGRGRQMNLRQALRGHGGAPVASKGTPARPFLELTDRDWGTIQALIDEFMHAEPLDQV